ncbi:MAG: PEP-CTERM sorting domain-containing protein [Armatimonadetes bacterium]|nr:PEP-CTERM sorting domain-containing protein [Armatimonadota bacterium]
MKAVALVMMILALACPSFAGSGEGGWWSVGDARIGMVARLGASDGLDSYDRLATANNYGWIAGSYHSADEWGSSAGFYGSDTRAPLAPGDTKAWMLYIWGAPGASHDFVVSWSASGSPDPLVQGKLELVQKPTDITGGPALGTVWTTPPIFTLPLYTTTDGLTGYGFKFTLTMIPEPSSLLALGLAASGLGGVALRRRWR